MNDPLDNVISAQLAPGERLVWSGKPRKGFRLSGQDFVLIPFSLIWCGFVLSWETAVVMSHGPLIMQLWGVPFVLVGLHILVGRFFVDALQRNKTFYGLTDDRVLIVSNFLFKNVKSVSLRTLGEISLSEGNDGSGSILLGPVRYSSSGPGVTRYSPPTLDSIPDVRRVHELILASQRRVLSGISQ
jgi:hypothetical protein